MASAVRRGEAVTDAQLATAAITFATMFVRRNRRPLRVFNLVAGFVWFSLPPAVYAGQHDWVLAAVTSLLPIMMIVGGVLGIALTRRANDALAANNALAAAQAPAHPASETGWRPTYW